MGKIHPPFLPAAAGVLLLAGWPLVFPDAIQVHQVLGITCLFATLALAWNIYALSGAISLGHAAFFGLGAYAWRSSTTITTGRPFSPFLWGPWPASLFRYCGAGGSGGSGVSIWVWHPWP